MLRNFGWALLVLVVAVLHRPGEAQAQAQNYENFRFGAGFLGGYASGLSGGGFGGMVEPTFLIHDNIGVGLRAEGMVTFGFGADDVDLGSGTLSAVLAKGQYLLGDYGVRPFAGGAIGMYTIGGQDISSSDQGVVVDGGVGRKFGMALQIGLDLGRVRLATSYNQIFGASVEVRDELDPGSIKRFSHNYWTFELSFIFGGTKKPASLPAQAP